MKDFTYLPLFAEREEAVEDALRQSRSCLPGFFEACKYTHSEHGFYAKSENVEWTTGFWVGELNLAYELSHESCFFDAAKAHIPSFLDRIVRKVDVEHHDMGFLYSPSCVAFYQLCGDKDARKASLLAADNLVSRFQERGQFIQAWGPMGEAGNYRLIIDCLMNLPLLFWASRETGEPRYEDIARRHLHTALACVLRADNSTYHTYFFDPQTGKPVYGRTAQGYRDGSAWARGQAWGVYGSAVAYRYLHDDRSMEVFERTLSFFLDHLPPSIIPYWDFDFTDGSAEPRDSSALAIVVCGMLEMAEHGEGQRWKTYLSQTAERLTRVLWKECAVKDPAFSNGQLLHGTYAKKSPYNTVRDRGVDECNLWGDYYYVEALRRLAGGWESCW